MKKDHVKRNLANIGVFLVFFLLGSISLKYDFINTKDFNKQIHMNILTVNSIFAGFLFTSLGIITGFMDNEKISNLDKNGYMDRYYNSIYIGLIFHILSALLAVFGFIYSGTNNIKFYLIAEQISLLGGIIFFISSILNVKKIINKIRNN